MAEILQNAGYHRILAIMCGLAGENPLELIELAGRTSYQSRDRITEDSASKFVEMIRKRGHEAVIEHSSMMVEFNNCSRGFTHELCRHRIASFLQESTRYVDESNFRVVAPPKKDIDAKLVDLVLPDGHLVKFSFRDWVELNEQMYRGLRKADWVPQDARQILPTGIVAQIVMTANFREWRHVFQLRCALDAHWEIRRIMVNLLKDVQERVPVVFDDFEIDEEKITAFLKK
jgi:thymidylate synthase (FAD)